MLAVKTSPQLWTLIDCMPATDETPGALYVLGFGHVVKTYDELTRVYQVIGQDLKRIK